MDSRTAWVAKRIPAMALAAFSLPASASGFQLLEQNASGLGNAYAGSAAVAEDASTVYFNPAGMTRLQRAELSAGAAVIRPSYRYSNADSQTGVLSGNGGDAGAPAVLPNAYGSYAVRPNLYLGLGIGAPFGLKTEYDNPWSGAAQSVKFDVKTVNLNPSVAWRASENWAFGAGVNYQKIDIDYVRAVSVAAAPYAASTARFKADDTGTGWNVGVLFAASPAMRVGMSYRSSVSYTVTGDLTVTGPVPALNAAGSSTARANVKLPSTFILSVVQKLDDRWEMLGDLSRTQWSSIRQVDIERSSGPASGQVAQSLQADFRDTWRLAFGGTYLINDAWRYRFGIAYDQSPVKGADQRLVSLPDNDRLWFSSGVQWQPRPGARLDLGLAYLYIRPAAIHNDQRAAAPTANRGLVDGRYTGSVVILGLQYSQAF